MKQCSYCRKADIPDNAAHCPHCGALCGSVEVDIQPRSPRAWHDLFFYNGHVVWVLHDMASDDVEYQFWRGDQLLQRLVFNSDMLKELCGATHPGEMVDVMSVVWPLFEIAQGERDVLTWQERNNRYPATFEIRRIEHPQRDEWRRHSMDRHALLEAVRR